MLVGSTALQVATHAAVPVVVIPWRDAVDPGPEAGRVVVGDDGSEASSEALVRFRGGEHPRRRNHRRSGLAL